MDGMDGMEKAALGLVSNVWHAHDYCFKRDWDLALLRVNSCEATRPFMPRRRDLLKALNGFGVQTVPNAPVEDLLRDFDPAFGVVVYLDERAHRGEGKELMSARDALDSHPKAWCSLFIPPSGLGFRHFQWGDRAFSMAFGSGGGDWRSQKGAGAWTWTAPGSPFDLFPMVPYPFFAVDFVPGTQMATDVQFVPGHLNDGIDEWLDPRQKYDALARAAAVLEGAGKRSFNLAAGYGLVSRADVSDGFVLKVSSASDFGWDESDAYGLLYSP